MAAGHQKLRYYFFVLRQFLFIFGEFYVLLFGHIHSYPQVLPLPFPYPYHFVSLIFKPFQSNKWWLYTLGCVPTTGACSIGRGTHT